MTLVVWNPSGGVSGANQSQANVVDTTGQYTATMAPSKTNGGTATFLNGKYRFDCPAGASALSRIPIPSPSTTWGFRIPIKLVGKTTDTALRTLVTVRPGSSGTCFRIQELFGANAGKIQFTDSTGGHPIICAEVLAFGTEYEIVGNQTGTSALTWDICPQGSNTPINTTPYSSAAWTFNVNAPGVVDFGLPSADADAMSDEFGVLQTDDGRTTRIPAFVAASNNPPQVTLSSDDLVYNEKDSTFSVKAVVTDSDGTVNNITWSFDRQPATSTLTGASGTPAATSTFGRKAVVPGWYVIRCVATDNGGATSAPKTFEWFVYDTAECLADGEPSPLNAWSTSGGLFADALSDKVNIDATYIKGPDNPSGSTYIDQRYTPVPPAATFGFKHRGRVQSDVTPARTLTYQLRSGPAAETLIAEWGPFNSLATIFTDLPAMDLNPTQLTNFSAEQRKRPWVRIIEG